MEVYDTNGGPFKSMTTLKKTGQVAVNSAGSTGDLNIFQEVTKLAGTTPRTYNWYRDTVRSVASKNDIYSTLSTMEEVVIPSPGELYLFEYKATYANKLNYYDEFPLVYITQGGKKFRGANLHYLGYKARLNAILQLEQRRMEIPKQCYHNYVYEGLETPLFKINREDYKSAIFLPVESFVTRKKGSYKQVSKSFVWGDSKK